MAIDVKSEVSALFSKNLDKLHKLLLGDAISAGWPLKAAALLKISVVSGELKISYPESAKDVVEDLEYGTRTSTPLPVIRYFTNRHGDVISNIIAEATINAMDKSGVL